MKKLIQIEPLSSARFTAPEHAEVMVKFLEVIKVTDPTQIGLNRGEIDEMQSYINVEIDINREVARSAMTAQLNAKDQERDGFITAIFSSIRNARSLNLPGYKEAGEGLMPIVETYNGLQTMRAEIETVTIDGLIVDLKKGANPVFMQTLGLQPLIDGLQQANQAYREMSLDRTSEKIDNKLPTSKEARALTDQMFNIICHCIVQSHYDTNDASDMEETEQIVANINSVIKDAKSSSKTAKAAAKKSEETTTE